MAVITISTEYGSDVTSFAQKLAQELGYRILSHEMIVSALRAPVAGKEATAETEQSLRHVLDQQASSVIKKVMDRALGRIDQAHRDLTRRLVAQAAHAGNVVILGLGSQCILQDHPGAVHLRIVKDMQDRMAWFREKLGIEDQAAANLIHKDEEETEAYIRHCFGRHWGDPHLYHLTINLSKVSLDDALQLVLAYVRSLHAR